MPTMPTMPSPTDDPSLENPFFAPISSPPPAPPFLKKVSRRGRWLILWTTIFILACVAFVVAGSRPPYNFVPNTLVHVSANMPLSSVEKLLKADHVIASTHLFRLGVFFAGGSSSVHAGDYFFQNPASVWQIAARLAHGEQGLTPVRVTFPEGTSIRGMSVILGQSLSTSTAGFAFDTKTFLSLASTSEGYLFPDTYFFPPNVTPAVVIATMKEVFDQKVRSVQLPAARQGHTLHDVIIMASILEKEALTDTDRRIIAGVLWKRLAAGQLLQIDPPFAYALGKTSDALTLADLQVNSPYNTYKYKGLPPTAINNPGLEALTAAVNASTTPYWYYLGDKNGVMHYAVTYAQHLANRAKYLGK